MRDFVILIDLDDSVSRTMARRLRAEHIYCRVIPATVTAESILNQDVRGILVAAASTGIPAELPYLRAYLQTGLPMLCMGDAALTLCEMLGGTLSERPLPGGVDQVGFDRSNAIFDGIEDGQTTIRSLE